MGDTPEGWPETHKKIFRKMAQWVAHCAYVLKDSGSNLVSRNLSFCGGEVPHHFCEPVRLIHVAIPCDLGSGEEFVYTADQIRGEY